MTPENETKLYNKYPSIFSEKNLSMRETCMCWGCECGNGWYSILDELCEAISFVDKNHTVRFTQVKEKFGTLRIYHTINDSKEIKIMSTIVDALISHAENQSAHTCELCGEYGSLNKNGWLSCLCEKCKTKKDGE